MATFKKKKKNTPELHELHYKNVTLLSDFTAEGGKMLGRRHTGFCAKKQRALGRAIKRARSAGLLPFCKTSK